MQQALNAFKQQQNIHPRKIIIYRLVNSLSIDLKKFNGEAALMLTTAMMTTNSDPNPFYKSHNEPVLTYILTEKISNNCSNFFGVDQQSKSLQSSKRGASITVDNDKTTF